MYFRQLCAGIILGLLLFGMSLSPIIVSPVWGQDSIRKPTKKYKKRSHKKISAQQSAHKEGHTRSKNLTFQSCKIAMPQRMTSLPYFFLTSKPLSASMSLPGVQEPLPKSIESGQETLQAMTVLAVFTLGEGGLRFDWGEKNPALAVVKGTGKWWVVFDECANVSLPDLQEHPIPGLLSLDTVRGKDGVVLQLMIHPHLTPIVARDGNIWQISFKSQPLLISHNASIQLPQLRGDGLVARLEAPGKEVRFKDPHTGYLHVIIPSYQVGFGIAQDQVFPEIEVMASTQGIGFQLLKDDLTIQITSGQATVTHPEGLAITFPQERAQIRTKAMTMGLFADAKDLDWVDRRQKINEGLLDLPHDQHGPGELELAWLLLSYGQASEAMGYLTHLARMRPSIANLALYQVLQGVGNLLLNRLPESEHHLRAVQDEPEVQIWLSLLKALQQPHHFMMNSIFLMQLRSQFQMAKSLLQSYPRPLRNQLMTLILLAGIATEDIETLTSFIDQETRPENLGEGEVFDLAKTRVLMSQNKPDAALQLLGELMEKAMSPIVRAIARFDYVVYRLKTNMMKEEEALPQLELLHFQWRGGWFGHKIAAYLARRETEKSEIK